MKRLDPIGLKRLAAWLSIALSAWLPGVAGGELLGEREEAAPLFGPLLDDEPLPPQVSDSGWPPEGGPVPETFLQDGPAGEFPPGGDVRTFGL